MQDWKDSVEEIVNDETTNIYDIYFLLFSKCIKDTADPGKRLEYILEITQEKIFSQEGKSLYVSDSVIENGPEQYMENLHSVVKMVCDQNHSTDVFYRTLFSFIFSGGIFPVETAIQSYLLYLLAERTAEIPYYQADDLLILSDERYGEIVNRIRPQVKKAIAMLNRNFKSRTEEASQLYHISQSFTSEDERIVYWSVIIKVFKTMINEAKNTERNNID